MKNINRIICMFVVCMAAMATLGAHDGAKHTFAISPVVGYQKVSFYNSKYDDVDLDTFGYGISCDYRFRPVKKFDIGLGLSLEQYKYEHFYDYVDFKTVAKARYHFYSFAKGSTFTSFSLSAGLGADYISKSNDREGLYPLVMAGLGMDFFPKKDISGLHICSSFEVQMTFQDGSRVLNPVGSLGLAYSIGAKGADR